MYVPFYGTALGLLGIALMLILECGRRRRSSRELLVLSIQGPSLDGSREGSFLCATVCSILPLNSLSVIFL